MQALSEYVKGKDVVVNLPTGYGKSLIYSLCPLVCDNLRNVKSKKERSMLLLISPLTALMDDQRLSLAQLGLSTLKLTPNVSEADISRIQRYPSYYPFSRVVRVCCCEENTAKRKGAHSLCCHRRSTLYRRVVSVYIY